MLTGSEVAGHAPRHDAARTTMLTRVLRTPLLTKIVFLDLVINVVAFVVAQRSPQSVLWEVTVASLVVVLVLNAGLVAVALRPLRVLEDTARRVTQGELSARTRMPRLADRNLVRIGEALDSLLDGLASERLRVRALAAQVVAAGDVERAHIARELHDGTAQSLSAIEMLLSSLLAEQPATAQHERLGVVRDIATEALAEVRALSHAVHPRVLDDLGLAAALEQLVRRTRAQSGLHIELTIPGGAPRALPTVASSVLYRVAQEALHNVVKHARATRVAVTLDVTSTALALTVSDDGVGFDPAHAASARSGLGLFVMQERVALVDGTFALRSHLGEGTELRVTVPHGEAA